MASHANDNYRQVAEWADLYQRLQILLTSHGQESPYSNKGDFWLVDDNWGGDLQKVCVGKIEFLTPKLAGEVQTLLRDAFPDWGVMFQLEISVEGKAVPPEGIIVRSERIEEHWVKPEMAKIFGLSFRW
jgi:hypothetical protein